MVGPESRYAGLDVVIHDDGSGRRVAHLTRRFLPDPATLEPRSRVAVVEGDRLDRVAERSLGDPGAWWVLPDANPCLHPDDLVADPGRLLLVALQP